MSTWITICEGCKREGWDESIGRTDGQKLAELIEPLANAKKIATRRVSCTMGCARACNIIVQGQNKIGYSIGTFDPEPEAATAIVDFASLHQSSETGQVPFRQWPQGVKGHFVSRHLPLPDET